VIDHTEIRERLELAAVDPGGLDRLAAGDTPESAAIAGHLAGCPSCAEEARRLATIGPILREVAATIPPDSLRERTLALVRDTGRPRGAVVPEASSVGRAAASGDRVAASGPRRRGRFGWPAAIAAALAVILAGGGLLGLGLTRQLSHQAETLAELNTATLRLSAEPDAVLVALSGKDGAGARPAGTLLFSPTTTELVVSAAGLAEPPAGQQLACWVARDGIRTRIGSMEFGAGLAYWTGWAEELRTAGPGTLFGVTMVGPDGKPVGPGDVLTGTVRGG
jgi:Anti-sigma-K factor rskA, C-terminal